MRPAVWSFALLGLLFTSCADEVPDVGARRVEYTAPTPTDLGTIDFPTNDAGEKIVFETSGAEVILDPNRIPADALLVCAAWVTGCYQPGARSLDDCMFSVPRCETEEPWNEAEACCPKRCYEDYARARANEGLDVWAAFRRTLYARDSCIPGLTESLGEFAP